jgi:hypothetical protein
MIDLEAEPVCARQWRGDIINTMHRAFAGRGQDRGITDYVIDADATSFRSSGASSAPDCMTN